MALAERVGGAAGVHGAVLLRAVPEHRAEQQRSVGRGALWQVWVVLHQARVLPRRAPSAGEDADSAERVAGGVRRGVPVRVE